MTPGPRARATLAAALCAAAPLAAQQTELRGRIADAHGRPLPGLEVALHRVTPAGGALVARDTSGPDGRFAFPVPSDDASAIYFAATRVAGTLYVGPPFRPRAVPADYTLRVAPGETPPTAQAPKRPGAPPPARDHRPAVGLPLLLAPLLAAAARQHARGRRRHRTHLLEVARLDEEHARAGHVGHEPAPEELRRRNELLARLRAPDPSADR